MIRKASAIKRIAINERNKFRNKVYKTSIKTLTKKYLSYLNKPIEVSSQKQLRMELSIIHSKLDKAVKRKIFHQNNAARKKRMLSKILKQLIAK